jgi:hypothetical protein
MEVGESCKNTRWVHLWSIAMSPTTQEDTRNLQNCFHPFAGRARAEEGREGGLAYLQESPTLAPH